MDTDTAHAKSDGSESIAEATVVFHRSARERTERELAQTVRELKDARAEIAVLTEQLDVLRVDAEDASVRALVSDNTGEMREARHAKGHAERLEQALSRARSSAVRLEARRDALLLSLPID